MPAQPVSYVSEEEYLAREEKADYKSEYYKGVIYAMAGGTRDHSVIAVNCIVALSNALRDRCQVYNSDLRLNIPGAAYCTYPDLAVASGEVRSRPKDPNSILNPILIVEVLSSTTQHIDRGRKYREYRKIESLREYVMISQDEPLAERIVRNANGEWVVRDPEAGLDAELALEGVECRIPMSEIYRNIEFAAVPAAVL